MSEEERLPIERQVRARVEDGSISNPAPVGDYREVQSWVLVGDPGAGKTDVFKTLALKEGGYRTSAADFLDLNLPQGWNPPLFIDGLDEVSAGTLHGQTPLGRIRTKLQDLGVPKFRISCREADWRGSTDSAALQRLVKGNDFAELHLEPLNHEQTKALIAYWQPCDEATAEAFIREAKSRDLGGLLDNPQTLRMLAKAVPTTADGWPESKTKTYELACAQLVREHNTVHLEAKKLVAQQHDKLLSAAGYMSVVMLLSGGTGISLQASPESRTGIVALPELISTTTAPALQHSQAALQTRLFRGNGVGDFWPAHRTVGEYLGAQYLVLRIREGLPFGRLLALMLGEDGGVVSELRGLHAWLAAVAPSDLRRELIDYDPLGVVVNGDVRDFSRDEKLHVFNALQEEARHYTYFRNQNWNSSPFGALATVDMAGEFRKMLASSDRSSPHQALIDCVLDALAHGHHMPELATDLERIVRDKSYWPPSRTEALGILVADECNASNWQTLSTVLDDVHRGAVEDQEDELLGTLLQALYPAHISPAEVLTHLRKPKSRDLLGAYFHFWRDLPTEHAPAAHIPALLDELHKTELQRQHAQDHRDTFETIGGLLVRGVALYGDQVDTERLNNWLSLGLGLYDDSYLEDKHKNALVQWLNLHSTIYKNLFEHHLDSQANSNENGFSKLRKARAQLFDADEPVDADVWYLSLADTTEDANLRWELLLDASQAAHRKNGPDAALQMLEHWSSNHAVDAVRVSDYLCCTYPPPATNLTAIDAKIARKNRIVEDSRKKIDAFRELLPSFAAGPAHLGALVDVANAYLNFFRRSNEPTPNARLLELLNQNKEWVDLALQGLRQCLRRADLPSAKDILDLHIKGQYYNMATPCLAAMELLHSEAPESAFDLSASTLQTAVAFRLTNNFGNAPTWFDELLEQQPDIFITVMQELLRKQIAEKTEYIDGLYALAHRSNYAPVAKQIIPQLISDFPVKATRGGLKNLRLLIVSMLNNLGRETQLHLVAKKLSAMSIDVAQEVYWLTAGMLVAPDMYEERTKSFVGKTQARADHLFVMIHEQRERGDLHVGLPTTTQVFLIALLGPRSSPSWPMKSGTVTPQMEMGRLVGSLISSLAAEPGDGAMQALIELQQRPDLKQWQESFNQALFDQRIVRRKALFKPATVAQVCITLANLKPANAADLWALTVNHLKQLTNKIRNGSTNDYLQYWAADAPKLEADCRDALLSDLKAQLEPLGISAEREGNYADEKRADIKVIAGSLHLPIEIKCEWNKALWTAIREQLIAKYGREFTSDGYGIYLVFWFAGMRMPVAGDGHGKPKTPKELQHRLVATVPPELKHKIAVLVVDCSKR